MAIRKQYGVSQESTCPHCGSRATVNNSQGVPVCPEHRDKTSDKKCVCGKWLDVKVGKWGPYFSCVQCGIMSFQKGLQSDVGEKNGVWKVQQVKKTTPSHTYSRPIVHK